MRRRRSNNTTHPEPEPGSNYHKESKEVIKNVLHESLPLEISEIIVGNFDEPQLYNTEPIKTIYTPWNGKRINHEK